MEQAFQIISDKTVLDFYEKGDDEEISVTCDSNNKMDEGLFIAGVPDNGIILVFLA